MKILPKSDDQQVINFAWPNTDSSQHVNFLNMAVIFSLSHAVDTHGNLYQKHMSEFLIFRVNRLVSGGQMHSKCLQVARCGSRRPPAIIKYQRDHHHAT